LNSIKVSCNVKQPLDIKDKKTIINEVYLFEVSKLYYCRTNHCFTLAAAKYGNV